MATADPKNASKKKAGAKQLLLALFLLIGMAVGSASLAVILAAVAIRPSAQATGSATEGSEEPSPETMPGEAQKDPQQFEFEEPMLVNVRNTQQRRYLSAKPVFVMANKVALKQIEEKQAELRNVLITILMSKTLEQLDDPQINNILGREVQEVVNAELNLNGGLTKVYFTQLVVQ